MAPEIGDVEPGHEPTVEEECPQCGGTVALYLGEVGPDDEEQCTIEAIVHREPE